MLKAFFSTGLTGEKGDFRKAADDLNDYYENRYGCTAEYVHRVHRDENWEKYPQFKKDEENMVSVYTAIKALTDKDDISVFKTKFHEMYNYYTSAVTFFTINVRESFDLVSGNLARLKILPHGTITYTPITLDYPFIDESLLPPKPITPITTTEKGEKLKYKQAGEQLRDFYIKTYKTHSKFAHDDNIFNKTDRYKAFRDAEDEMFINYGVLDTLDLDKDDTVKFKDAFDEMHDRYNTSVSILGDIALLKKPSRPKIEMTHTITPTVVRPPTTPAITPVVRIIHAPPAPPPTPIPPPVSLIALGMMDNPRRKRRR
jgi:hypothetical protein